MLKVVVIDDSLAIQRSLGRLLGSIAGVEMVGCAQKVAPALRLVDALEPDVVVLDANLADGESGLGVLRHIGRQHPRMRVILLTNTASPETRQVYLEAGAQAWFDKATEFMQARDWIARLSAQRSST